MAIVDTREMRVERHKLILEARKVLDKADEEKRSLTAEDRQQYDKLMADAGEQLVKIEDVERRNRVEREQVAGELREEEEERKRKKTDEDAKKKAGTDETAVSSPMGTEEYRSAFRAWLIKPRASIDPAGVLGPEEHRALSAGTGTEGGYLYADTQFVDDIIQDVTDATIVRGLASHEVLPSADTLPYPVITNRMAAAVWTSELGIASRDATLAFGQRNFTPHPLAKEIPVSKVLLRKSPKALEIVRKELARVVAEANENGFLNGKGAGAKQPLGMFTASNNGISTSRDVSTGNLATSPTFDGLKAAKYELKQAYWNAASWIFHRDIMELIAKLKDGEGRYLLQDSVVAGEPDRMLKFPVHLCEFAPKTITTKLYVGILGDFKEYLIVDAMDMQIARAEELLIRSNQDLFIIRMETDGGPKKEEAFVRVKLA